MSHYFNALDAAGSVIKIGAMHDDINDTYYPNVAPDAERIDQFLSSVGDGSGTVNANGNYSIASDDFFIAPPAGEKYVITRMIPLLEDNSSFRAEYYTGSGALAVGVDLIKSVGGVETSLTPIKIKTISGFAGYCHDISRIDFGAGNDFITLRWTFALAGATLVLDGATSDKLIIRLADDLSALVTHRFLVQGYKFTL